MRWTDLPRDREAADAETNVPPRGEWDELRQRLERLPAGHPSAPDAADGAAENGAADDGAGDGCVVDDLAVQDGAVADRPGIPDGHAGPGGYRAGRPAGADRSEPYRPWFATGESPEPWFWADPGA